MGMGLQVFESYAREDEDLREQLDKQLASLKGRLPFDVWHGERVLAGDEREQVFTSRQQGARIQLLLISADYFGSPACERQMERALELHKAGRARVIPILVRAVNWEDSPIARLKVLPRNGKPVASWDNPDEAWRDVVQGIRVVLDEELAREQGVSSGPEVTSRQAPPDPVRSLVEGLPRGAKRAVESFLHYYLGRGGRGGPIFSGRGAELETFERWLDDPGAPQCLLITGPGGRGKSALLAHWVQRVSAREGLDVVFFPISMRFGTNRAGLLYHALAARLSWLCGEPLPSEQNTPVEILRDVISELLSHPARERRLLVVIDALDEAADAEVDTTLFPIPLPEGVRIVISARPRPGERDSWLRQLGWDQRGQAQTRELGRLSRQGVADALAQLPQALEPLRRHPGFADALFHLSEGDPLVLRLYLEWLEDNPEVREPEQLPTEEPGLDSYFQLWWDAQQRHWGPQARIQEPRVQRLLALLACALGPLTRKELLEVLGEETGLTFDTTLESLSRLVIGDDKHGYALTHPGLGEYFQGKLSDTERRQYEGRFLTWGEQTLQALRSGTLKAGDVPSYLVRHYAAHLERSGEEPEALLRLVNDSWRRASEAREQTNAVFLEDVMRAWRAVRRRNEERVKAGEVPDLSDELRCAAVRTSIHSLARNFTPFVISALVEKRLWSIEVALAHARHEPKSDVRCLGLLGLARLAPEPLRSEILEEVIDTAPAIENPYGRETRVLQELAPQLSSGLLARAMARIESFPHEEHAALTLAILAHHAPEWAQRVLVPRVLVLARALDERGRGNVLAELGTNLIEAHGGGASERPIFGRAKTTTLDARYFLSLASDEGFPAVRENARASLATSWKWHATTEVPDLPASLPPATIRELLTRVRATCPDMACATAIEILAPRLEGALLDEAVHLARQMVSPPVRSKLLAVLSSRFPPPRQRELLREALEIAQSLADVSGVVQRLAVLTDPLSESHKREVLLGALGSVNGLAQSRGRLMKQAALVPVLPQPERENVFVQVLRDAEATASPSTWVDIIWALGPAAGDPRLWSALERANPLTPVAREEVLEFAGPYLPEHWLEGALEYALEDTNSVSTFLAVEKRALLVALAPRLSERLQERAVARLLTEMPRTVVECVEILGPHLLERLTGRLVEMSRKLGAEGQAVVLASLLPRVPEAERAALLEEVLRLVTEESSRFDYRSTRALRAIAPHLTEKMLSRVVDAVRKLGPSDRMESLSLLAPFSEKAVEALRQHALDDARAEAREDFRSGLLARAGPWLLMPEVLEALQLAKQLGEPDDRAVALAGLLPSLPIREREEAIELALRDAVRSKFRRSRLKAVASHASRMEARRLYPLLSDTLATSLSSVIRGELYDAIEALVPVLHALGGEEELVRSIQTLLEIETWWS